jgi:photosystem II stability/assembly factor-like uncharacterized protein
LSASLGAVAVAPFDPNVVYVGAGKANIRGNVEPGNGIYKSTDGGKTWKHVWTAAWTSAARRAKLALSRLDADRYTAR